MRGIIIITIAALFSISANARQTPKYDIYSLGNDRNSVLRVRDNFRDIYQNKLDASYLDEIETIKMPAGAISMYGGATAPEGWLLCDGAAVSRSTYVTLFTAIGTTFGTGDGSTTFNLPDFRGVFPKGAGTTNRAAGKDAAGNYYTGTLGTYSQDKMQGHYHNFPRSTTGTSAPKYIWSTASQARVNPHYADYDNNAKATSPATDGANGTPRTGVTTEPQSLTVTFIIKY